MKRLDPRKGVCKRCRDGRRRFNDSSRFRLHPALTLTRSKVNEFNFSVEELVAGRFNVLATPVTMLALAIAYISDRCYRGNYVDLILHPLPNRSKTSQQYQYPYTHFFHDKKCQTHQGFHISGTMSLLMPMHKQDRLAAGIFLTQREIGECGAPCRMSKPVPITASTTDDADS